MSFQPVPWWSTRQPKRQFNVHLTEPEWATMESLCAALDLSHVGLVRRMLRTYRKEHLPSTSTSASATGPRPTAPSGSTISEASPVAAESTTRTPKPSSKYSALSTTPAPTSTTTPKPPTPSVPGAPTNTPSSEIEPAMPTGRTNLPPEVSPATSPVSDLMAALETSVKEAKEARASRRTPSRATTPESGARPTGKAPPVCEHRKRRQISGGMLFCDECDSVRNLRGEWSKR